MLAMAEDFSHDNLLWDDQTWSFPNLAGAEEECNRKSPEFAPTADVQEAEEEEAPTPALAPAPPMPAPKGKKRTAAAVKEGGAGGGENGQNNNNNGGGGESDDHELHIWTERERRKKMRNMFANLHALIPHLPPKADKSTIVDEAVNYIKKLQETLEKMEKQKLERLHGVISITNPINYIDPSIISHQKLAMQSREAFLAEQGSTSALPNQNQPFPGPDFPAIFKTWTSPNVILNICGNDAHISVCSPKKPGLLTAICFVMEKHKLEMVSLQVSSDRSRCMYMIHARANGGSDQFQQGFAVEEIYKQAAAELMLWVNS